MGFQSRDREAVLPWVTRISISFICTLFDAARRSNGTVNRRLVKIFDLRTPPNATPCHGASTRDVTLDPSRTLWCRVYSPTLSTGAGTLPVVVFFHGGGFAFLAPNSLPYDNICRRLCRKIPAVLVSVNYRLTPEHRFPSQYDDGEDVLRFLDKNRVVLPEYADLSKCFLAGDSAGANLAHHVAVRVGKMGRKEKQGGKSGLRRIRVIGLVSIQPWFGGEERTAAEVKLEGAPLVSTVRTDWLWKAFLPAGSDRNHGSSNVSGPNSEDLSGLEYPDTIVFVGGFDPLQDWQRRYYEWLKKSGKKVQMIQYPTMIHAFYAFPELPESTQLISQIKDFINNRISQLN